MTKVEILKIFLIWVVRIALYPFLLTLCILGRTLLLVAVASTVLLPALLPLALL